MYQAAETSSPLTDVARRAFMAAGLSFDPDLAAAGRRMWQGVSGRRGREAAAPSLEKGTLEDRVHPPGGVQSADREGWSVTLMQWGDVVEARAVRVHGRGVALRSPEEAMPENGDLSRVEPRTDAERFEASVRRSKQSVTRRMYALRADHMLTFTKRGKFETLDDAWSAWKKFDRLAKRRFRARWAFVAIPERHKDGTFHIHVAVRGFFDVVTLRVLWFRALGGKGNERGSETPGNVDAKSFVRVHGRAKAIARYMAKYLCKGFSAVDRGRRSYSCSSGLHPDRVTRWREPLHFGSTAAATSIQRRLSDALGVSSWSHWFWAHGGRTGFILTSLKGPKS